MEANLAFCLTTWIDSGVDEAFEDLGGLLLGEAVLALVVVEQDLMDDQPEECLERQELGEEEKSRQGHCRGG